MITPSIPARLVLLIALAWSALGAAELDGLWNGTYRYQAGVAMAPVDFLADLHGAGGTISEPNTFGDPAAKHLTATAAIVSDGDAVTFIKTYDGSGGVSHAITYAGKLSADGQRIEGTWTISPGWSGPFSMRRADALALTR